MDQERLFKLTKASLGRENTIEDIKLKDNEYLEELKKNPAKVLWLLLTSVTKKTLLPLIQHHIAEGSTIVLDCWEAYVNLKKHGYVRECVNHSKEFVNADGDHTNKIEGHWRQAKAKMPNFIV